jgi:two-component system KDP operon response regulator KdpE
MNSKPRILVVDDESAIRDMLSVHLSANDFQVGLAVNGSDALMKASEFHPHLIILDLGLPDMNGLIVLQKLRVWTDIPVVVLTVNDDEQKKVELLDAGADDYLTKPFSVPELLARIRVGLRRHHLAEATPIFKSGNLEVDLNQHKVKVGGLLVKLTSTEYELLSRLIRENGRVVPQSQLLNDVWGPQSLDQIQYLRIYIGLLRKKLEADPSAPAHILTEPGVGYRLI